MGKIQNLEREIRKYFANKDPPVNSIVTYPVNGERGTHLDLTRGEIRVRVTENGVGDLSIKGGSRDELTFYSFDEVLAEAIGRLKLPEDDQPHA